MSRQPATTLERRTKTCGLCGSRFGCAQGSPGCWCEQVALNRETLAEIRGLATDCVCAACLGGLAGRRSQDAGEEVWAKAVPDGAVRARGVSVTWAVVAVAFVFGSLLLGLAIGPARIGPAAIVGSALSHLGLRVPNTLGFVDDAILWQVPAPRVVLAAVVGGMLAVAGSAYQGVFRNALADPYLLGVAAGAGLGATVAIAYGSVEGDRALLLPPSAFVGATAGVAA